MTLEDKLREIVDELELYHYMEGNSRKDKVKPNTVESIKQAFADEGYRQITKQQLNQVMNKYIHEWPRMTGQEWYTRFEKELEPLIHMDGKVDTECADVLDAAKRASGIDYDPIKEEKNHADWKKKRTLGFEDSNG